MIFYIFYFIIIIIISEKESPPPQRSGNFKRTSHLELCNHVVFDLKLHMRTSLFSDKFDRFDNTKLSANLYAHLLVETRESVDYEIVLG